MLKSSSFWSINGDKCYQNFVVTFMKSEGWGSDLGAASEITMNLKNKNYMEKDVHLGQYMTPGPIYDRKIQQFGVIAWFGVISCMTKFRNLMLSTMVFRTWWI